MSQVAVVLWNPDEELTKAATTLHITDGEPRPEHLVRKNGQAIAVFFKERGISIERYMEMFPGYVVPTQTKNLTTWDSPLTWQRLPIDESSICRLVELIGMPISVFCHFRRNDTIPRFMYRASLNKPEA